MRRQLVILLVLFSVFLAIGCADNGNEETDEPEVSDVPAEEGTPIEAPVTPAQAVTPAQEPQSGGEGKIVEVAIQNSAFVPAAVTISTGDTVRWTNMDSAPHTATGPIFDSDELEQGESYQFVFTEPGVYNYNCAIHPSMEGTVTVVESS